MAEKAGEYVRAFVKLAKAEATASKLVTKLVTSLEKVKQWKEQAAQKVDGAVGTVSYSATALDRWPTQDEIAYAVGEYEKCYAEARRLWNSLDADERSAVTPYQDRKR